VGYHHGEASQNLHALLLTECFIQLGACNNIPKRPKPLRPFNDLLKGEKT